MKIRPDKAWYIAGMSLLSDYAKYGGFTKHLCRFDQEDASMESLGKTYSC